jgi:antitoxin PrlF
MSHSTITSKGQTTVPGEVREALGIKPGDRLEYHVKGNRASFCVHPGTKSLKGALASKKGAGMKFGKIRALARRAARRRGVVK